MIPPGSASDTRTSGTTPLPDERTGALSVGNLSEKPESTDATPAEKPISFEGVASIDKQKRDISAGILAETRRKILEFALLLEKGEVTEEVLEETKSSLASIAAEIEKRKSRDNLFNLPLLDQNLRIVFEDLPLLFSEDDEVQKALDVLQRTFRQKYNLVVIVDANRKALGIVSSAVLINSDPEELLKNVPTIKNGFAITLETKPMDVAAMMDRLGVNALPVVDDKGIVIGIFTMRDHTQGVTALYSKKLQAEMQTHAELGGFQKSIEEGEN
jgi:CBS domain-containing protein